MRDVLVERRWQHRGLDCAVLAQIGQGHRTGYVRVPEGHPWHGKDYHDKVPRLVTPDDKPVDVALEDHGVLSVFAAGLRRDDWQEQLEFQVSVHGGLTYADSVLPGVGDKGWWIGFDCAHLGDKPDPAFRAEYLKQLDREMEETYEVAEPEGQHVWTEQDVAREVERLAEQVANAA